MMRITDATAENWDNINHMFSNEELKEILNNDDIDGIPEDRKVLLDMVFNYLFIPGCFKLNSVNKVYDKYKDEHK